MLEHYGHTDLHHNMKIIFQIFLYSGIILVLLARLVLVLEERKQRKKIEARELKHQEDVLNKSSRPSKNHDDFAGSRLSSAAPRIHAFIYNLLMILAGILAVLFIEWLFYE